MENQAPPNAPGDGPHLDAKRAELLAKAREATTSPGVYLMKDAAGTILYVGKAKKLRNRLQSYFQQSPHPEARVELMVLRADRFDVILTETETEALILEAELIKKHRPKHNVRLKDDKAYPYIKIQVHEDFPRLEWTRRVKRDGARYFGPFPSAFAARQVLRLLTESYRLRDCSDNTFRHRSRPCILHQMGKCTAPCVLKITANEYRDTIKQVVRVLEGRSDSVLKELRRAMEDAAEQQEFEVAAEYRDQMRNLELVTQTQVIEQAGSLKDLDVLGLARQSTGGTAAHAAVLRIRGGKMLAVQHYDLQNVDGTLDDAELVGQVIEQYFVTQAEDAELKRAGEVLVPVVPSEVDWIAQSLGVRVRGPAERGVHAEADAQILALARSNAEYALEQKIKRTAGHGVEALEQVQEKLGLLRLPHRIECYDNSNIQGEDAVASRVVFIDGAPDKNLYRRYKIRTVEGANDFATMREVLGRRFAHSPDEAGEELPDLVVVDGGKGQLAQAVAILEELNIQGVGVVGLAKARTERDFEAAEVKSSLERVFIPGMKNPVPLLPHTGAYKLLVHVRDEAHRFAISYHRLLRGKKSLSTRKSED